VCAPDFSVAIFNPIIFPAMYRAYGSMTKLCKLVGNILQVVPDRLCKRVSYLGRSDSGIRPDSAEKYDGFMVLPITTVNPTQHHTWIAKQSSN